MKYTHSSHSVYYLQYHVIVTCKYRKKVLKPGVVAYMEEFLPTLLKEMPGVSLEEIGFDKDHVHMLLTIPPTFAIADVVARLKSRSASRLRKKFAWLGKVYWKENVVWSDGYFVSSVGVDEDTVKRYVKHQARQDSMREQLEL